MKNLLSISLADNTFHIVATIAQRAMTFSMPAQNGRHYDDLGHMIKTVYQGYDILIYTHNNSILVGMGNHLSSVGFAVTLVR